MAGEGLDILPACDDYKFPVRACQLHASSLAEPTASAARRFVAGHASASPTVTWQRNGGGNAVEAVKHWSQCLRFPRSTFAV